MEMKLFAVFKHGIYRHECAGIFSSLGQAEKVAKSLAKIGDKHHHYRIVAFDLDKQIGFTMPPEGSRYGDAEIQEPETIYSTDKADD